MKKYLLLSALIIILLDSCTVQKRIYRRGYSIDWLWSSKDLPSVTRKPKTPASKSSVIQPTLGSRKKETGVGLVPLELPSYIRKTDNSENGNKSGNPITPLKTGVSKQFKKDRVKESQSETIAPAGSDSVEKKERGKNADGYMYFAAACMALASIGLYKGNKTRATKITRWAKANPKKTRVMIPALHLPLLGLGLMSGYNMKEMGLEISDTVSYAFAAASLLGFMTVPFLPKHSVIAIPKKVNRQRLSYIGILLSSVMAVTAIGNRITGQFPNSPVSQAIKEVDHSLVSVDHVYGIGQLESESNHDNLLNKRQMILAGSCAAAVFIILLLCILVCAGICISIYGFALIFDALALLGILEGIGLILAGGLITTFAIRQIRNVAKWCK